MDKKLDEVIQKMLTTLKDERREITSLEIINSCNVSEIELKNIRNNSIFVDSVLKFDQDDINYFLLKIGEELESYKPLTDELDHALAQTQLYSISKKMKRE